MTCGGADMKDGLWFAKDFVQVTPWPIPKHVYVIAEIGINHNGDIEIAKKLISLAKRCGCDAVKFQKRAIDIVYPPEVLAAPRESPWGKTQRAQKEGLEFSEAQYDIIDAFCHEVGIHWFASAWDESSQAFLRKYNLPYNKIASAMLTNRDFVRMVAVEKRPTFISTGLSELNDVEYAAGIFQDLGCEFVLMHTVSEYPCPEELLNLSVMHRFRERFGCPVGYSGHEPSVSPSVIAAAFGAVAIERHITLDRSMYGSDQAASLEESGLALMVSQIRKIPVITGDGTKRTTEGEKKVASKLRYWRSEP